MSVFGYIIKSEYLKADAEKIGAVAEYVTDTRFLGFCKFFIHNFSRSAAPLARFTSFSLSFTSEAEQAISNLKSLFTSAAVTWKIESVVREISGVAVGSYICFT